MTWLLLAEYSSTRNKYVLIDRYFVTIEMALAGNFALEGFDFKRWVHWLGSPQEEQEALQFSSVQSLSHVQLCDSMGCRKPGLPVHHQLPELAQTYVCRVSNAIQPSHPLSFPSPGDLPDPGIKSTSPVLGGGFFTTKPPGFSSVQSLSRVRLFVTP